MWLKVAAAEKPVVLSGLLHCQILNLPVLLQRPKAGQFSKSIIDVGLFVELNCETLTFDISTRVSTPTMN